MSDLERRNRLAGQEPAEQTYGEGFIAIHMKDGTVHTFSGVVDLMEEKCDIEEFIGWYGNRRYMEATGWNVTVHFIGDIVEEIRTIDGKEENK